MNTGHVIRNESPFCSNCGRKQGVFAGGPTPDETASELENRNRWLKEGERGLSSEAIFSFFSGVPISGKLGIRPPSDIADFRRCYMLLKFVPSWRARISEIGSVSPVWAALAENWDKLETMLEAGMKTGKAPEMYQFMTSLGC